jgi:hypothetical protein
MKFTPAHLKNGEIFEDAVHHVLLGQVLELEDEVDHVLAHRGPVQLVQVPPALIPEHGSLTVSSFNF